MFTYEKLDLSHREDRARCPSLNDLRWLSRWYQDQRALAV